jgi:hypothetical protein
MTYPTFAVGEILTAADMNAVGLWLVKTQTVGTGVSSVTVTGAFSAGYDNYKITYSGGYASAAGGLNLSLGAATTNYYSASFYAVYSGGSNQLVMNNGPYFYYIGGAAPDDIQVIDIDVFNPFKSDRYTGIGGPFIVRDVAGSTGGVHKTNASYTSFNIFPTGGTLTGGTISVYGYKK